MNNYDRMKKMMTKDKMIKIKTKTLNNNYNDRMVMTMTKS